MFFAILLSRLNALAVKICTLDACLDGYTKLAVGWLNFSQTRNFERRCLSLRQVTTYELPQSLVCLSLFLLCHSQVFALREVMFVICCVNPAPARQRLAAYARAIHWWLLFSGSVLKTVWPVSAFCTFRSSVRKSVMCYWTDNRHSRELWGVAEILWWDHAMRDGDGRFGEGQPQ